MSDQSWRIAGAVCVVLMGCGPLPARQALSPADCITIDGETVPFHGAERLADALRMHVHGDRLGRYLHGGPPLLFVDGVRTADGASALASIPVSDVASVTLVRGVEATARFGTRGGNGAVLVRTRRAGASPPCGR